MKPPEECANLDEVRAVIDDIDHDIIALIGQRRGYVQAAAAFKTSATSVSAPDRVAAMLVKRREWATNVGLSPEIIEQVFRMLVSYFTEAEIQHWNEQNKAADHAH